MIVSDIRVPVRYTTEMLHAAIRKASGKKNLKIRSLQILRRSIDARKKPQIFYVMKAAVNEALRKGEEAREAAMKRMAPGIGGLF